MIVQIKKKLFLIDSKKPFSSEATLAIKKMELLEWVYMNLRLDGSDISRDEVNELLNGSISGVGTIYENFLIDLLQRMRNEFYRGKSYQEELDLDVVCKLYSMITGEDKKLASNKSDGNQVLITDHEKKSLKVLIRKLYNMEDPRDFNNPLKKAAMLHHGIISILDRLDEKPLLARVSMYFYIIQCNMPLFNITLSEGEYFSCTEDELYNNLVRGLYNRLEFIDQLIEN